MIHVTLNGEVQALPPGLDVAGLIGHLGLDVRKVAIERNLAIVPRSAYQATPLTEGDRIEIVAFIGGG